MSSIKRLFYANPMTKQNETTTTTTMKCLFTLRALDFQEKISPRTKKRRKSFASKQCMFHEHPALSEDTVAHQHQCW